MRRLPEITYILAMCALAVLLSACGSNRFAGESFAPPDPVQQVYEPPSAGSIYRAGTDVRLYEDLKAGRIGDILTVLLVESTNASKSSQTSTSKSTAVDLTNPVVFGRRLQHKNGTDLFTGSLSGDQSFDGSGSSSQSNSLAGNITVTVVERLPNGNLRIRGEKWVTLNQGKEFIQLSGIIRPTDILPDNTIISTRIADARITYSSKGVMDAANRMGWLARFFNSSWHPY